MTERKLPKPSQMFFGMIILCCAHRFKFLNWTNYSRVMALDESEFLFSAITAYLAKLQTKIMLVKMRHSLSPLINLNTLNVQ